MNGGIDITRSIGLDIGDVRIGVALSDPLGILASPHSIITRGGDAVSQILEIIRENGVGNIVIGLPLTTKGTEGHQAGKTREFAEELMDRVEIPVVYQDESLSTAEARRRINESRKTDRSQRYDAAAAALILQEYLDINRDNSLPDPGE